MRITRAEISVVDMPLKVPFIISYTRNDVIPSVILTLRTDTGLVGYGEAVPDEHVTGETIGSIVYALEHCLLPTLRGIDPSDLSLVHERMSRALIGNGAAKAAIDIACYDLLGKRAGLPVYTLLGGRRLEAPMIAKVLSILSPEEVAAQARGAITEGYTHLKLKLGASRSQDIAIVRAVREAVGTDIRIRVDANQGWGDVPTSYSMITALEPYGIDWFEQPLSADDLAGWRRLRERTGAVLMADETLVAQDDLERLMRDSSVDMINLKLMKSGGIHPCDRLATQAELGGMTAQLGSMLETSIGSAAGFHLALANRNIVSTELPGPVDFTVDPGDLHFTPPNVEITDRPGLGIDVDVEVLASLTVRRREVECGEVV